MWFVLKIRLLGAIFVIKELSMNEITLQNQQTLWRLLACHREWQDDFFGWAIKCSIFISVKDTETQGYFQCPVTHLTQVIIGCMV